jgi:phosphoethanolamine N-methyltransferase
MSAERRSTINQVQSKEKIDRYTRKSILRSEKMYGHSFQSPGNIAAMDAFCQKLRMRQGMQILDIGSGVGGASFYFAERYKANVVGLDVAQAMIKISTEHSLEKGLSDVTFVHGDIRNHFFLENSFDLVWTRDPILYLPEKKILWERVNSFLKPGGQLFITDFCRSKESVSMDFKTYLSQCGYFLQDIDQYAAGMAEAGFEIVRKEDITDQFINSLELERENLMRSRAEFLTEYEESDYQYLIERWDKKTRFCRQGDFHWGLFIAQKPGK